MELTRQPLSPNPTVTLLTTRAAVDDLVESGVLELFVGTPDTGGRGFVGNCPAPIVAPNDFRLA